MTRLEILAAVAQFADGSHSPRELVAHLLDLAVPELGDACMVDAVTPEGTTERLGVRFSGPGADELEAALAVRPLSPAEAPHSETRTLTMGESQLFEVTDELLEAASHGPEDLELLRAFELSWLMFVPLTARGRTIGALALATRRTERTYGEDDRRFVEILAGRLALALDNARLRREVGEVEHELAAILSGLADAVTVQQPDGQVIYANQAAAELLGFGTPAELLEAGGAAAMQRFETLHPDGRPVTVDELPGRRVLAGEDPEPLLVRTRFVETGVERWCVTKATAVRDERGEVRLAVNVIEDVTEQKRAELAQSLLAEASDLLYSSLDYERTLEQVAKLAVPQLADWCGFDMPDAHGGIRSVAIGHMDSEKVDMARRMRELYPVGPDAETGLGAVIRTGRPELHPEITDEMLQAGAHDERHLAWLRDVGFSSVLIVPVAAGPEVLGALTLVASESGRRFGEAELRLAEELGRRAGTAIANARLFSQRTEIAQTLQRGLLPPALPKVPGWSIATMFQAAGEANEVGGDFYDVFSARGDWYATIGDVAGKGAAAASLTSLARYTLRSGIALTGDPAAAMAQLNSLLRERDELALCSVACVRLRDGSADISSAGHPLPRRVRGGEVEEVGRTEPVLGAVADRPWTVTPVDIEPGDGLLLFTDGVIDTVGDSERFGELRLHDSLACSRCTSEDLIAGLERALSRFGRGPQADDTAALALVREG
jgi:PAS domain S-box-containing protein